MAKERKKNKRLGDKRTNGLLQMCVFFLFQSRKRRERRRRPVGTHIRRYVCRNTTPRGSRNDTLSTGEKKKFGTTWYSWKSVSSVEHLAIGLIHLTRSLVTNSMSVRGSIAIFKRSLESAKTFRTKSTKVGWGSAKMVPHQRDVKRPLFLASILKTFLPMPSC